MRRGLIWLVGVTSLAAAPGHAQDRPEACAAVPQAYGERCIAALQTASALQAQLGMLLSAGGPFVADDPPSPKALSRRRFQISPRLNFAAVRIPRITLEANPSPPPPLEERLDVVGLAAGVDVAVGIHGRVDAVASVAYLPFDLIDRRVFKGASGALGVGAGVRAGLLRESGAVPGLSVSVMYRHLNRVQAGNTCESERRRDPTSTTDPPASVCNTPGDVAEAGVGTRGLSARAVLSKRLGALSLGLGGGYDVLSGDGDAAVLGAEGTVAAPANLYHARPIDVSNQRVSAFLDAALRLPGAAAVLQLGWMQGGERVAGFPASSDFSPGDGTWFGSVGVRVSP
jgi:hypothetical protein